MVSKVVQKFIFPALGLLFIILLFWTYYASQDTSYTLLQAQKTYQAADDAPTIIQLSKDLNDVLRSYSYLEEQYNPMHGNGKLYNNIAATYFDLEQYPWAALYFYQAQALGPRNEVIEQNLQKTLAKLNLPARPKDSIFRKVFFFHFYLSLPERLQILSGLTLLLFALSSLFLWKRVPVLKGLIAAVIMLWTIFFCSVIYTKYFEPLEGVIVKDSMLYRSAAYGASFVAPKPIIGGSKVEVLDVLEDGKWLKIRNPDGIIGFIPSDSTRVLRT